ncbi:MAG TPA: hypothetical protein VGQ09_21175 [Chitinophagaceae bacterium]|nr:hypothetical protein [Chitinophagaceae bacterium]
MSKILVTSDSSFWYDQLNYVGYYGETEFQRAIQQHTSNIFPDYYCFPFSKSIKSKLGTSKPDLGLISKTLKEWWIIEVELGKHSLENHVLQQIDDFRLGNYPESIFAPYFQKKILSLYNVLLEESKIKNLLKKKTPHILVVVDEEKADWVLELKKREANLCLFQIFKNGKGRHAYRLNGNYPFITIEETHCKPHKFYQNNMLELSNPVFIRNIKNTLSISFDELQTRWEKIVDKNKTYIRFIGKSNPLPPNSTFLLVQDSQKKLIMIKN